MVTWSVLLTPTKPYHSSQFDVISVLGQAFLKSTQKMQFSDMICCLNIDFFGWDSIFTWLENNPRQKQIECEQEIFP